jgi:ESCRT-II complex subunit VPS25
MAAATVEEYVFPDCYSFPPFFTLQPVAETRAKQLVLWLDFLKSYQHHHKRPSLLFPRDFECELFCNKQIKRKLPIDGVHAVLDEAAAQGLGSWATPDRIEFSLSWRTCQEWGQLIFKWVILTLRM